MKTNRTTWVYPIALFLGVTLFYLGWSQVQKAGTPYVDSERIAVVVRPVTAELSWSGGSSDPAAELGLHSIPSDADELKASRESWDAESAPDTNPAYVRTLRLKPPKAKIDPRTQDGSKVSLSVLPEKEEKPRESGYIRLQPGRYKFLATAEGHLPKSIDLELSAGVAQKITVDLEKLPTPPDAAAVTAPANVSRPVYPSRPVYRPPPRVPSRPRPRPRFTPVAPKPPPRPAPVFTPFP